MTERRVHGVHAVRQLLKTRPESILEFFLQDGQRGKALQALEADARELGLNIVYQSRHWLDQHSEGGRHQGVLVRARPPRAMDEDELLSLLERQTDSLLLILDSIEDPHNLGACLRTADAAGVLAVVTPRHRGVGLTATVCKVACGAAEHTPLVTVTNLARFLERLKKAGVWLVGTSGSADTELYQLDLRGPLAVILGAEGQGIRRLTAEHCDFLASIPMHGVVDSLNVSAAAAVCLFEAVRQRSSNPAAGGHTGSKD